MGQTDRGTPDRYIALTSVITWLRYCVLKTYDKLKFADYSALSSTSFDRRRFITLIVRLRSRYGASCGRETARRSVALCILRCSGGEVETGPSILWP